MFVYILGSFGVLRGIGIIIFYLQVERAEQGDSDPASVGSTGKVLILGYGARLLRVVLTSFFSPGE